MSAPRVTAAPLSFRALEMAGIWGALFLRGSELSPISQRSFLSLPFGSRIQQAYNTGAARRLDKGVVRGTLGRSPVEQCREVRDPRARGAVEGRAADAPAGQVPGSYRALSF